jgi:F-type H+-transporting ATPase subunit b
MQYTTCLARGGGVINIDLAFVIQLINFLILILVLNILLYKPLRKVIAERQGRIAEAKGRADSVEQDLQIKMAEYEARLKAMKSGAADERGALVKEAQAEEATILEAARKDAAATLAAIKERVSKEAAAARTLLQEQAKALSVDICEKVLGRSL